MTYDIDPVFSVYRLVERIQHISVLINHRRTMSIISREIENTCLQDGVRTRVFCSFQYLRNFLPQVERYRQLAALSESVYIFGVPDIDVPEIPNLHYVPLTPQHQLTREWFLISFGAAHATALATEEISQPNTPDHKRRFQGLWTFDRFHAARFVESGFGRATANVRPRRAAPGAGRLPHAQSAPHHDADRAQCFAPVCA